MFINVGSDTEINLINSDKALIIESINEGEYKSKIYFDDNVNLKSRRTVKEIMTQIHSKGWLW